ncbi:DUF1684 domain-containing protein [Nocardioides sp. HB32]
MGDFLAEWQTWRTAREARLRDPHGWLAITAIHWLTAEPQRFDDLPGEWRSEQDGPVVTLDDGERRLGPVDEDGLTLAFEGVTAEVADRDGRVIVRPRRPDSANLRTYRGTPCYPPDPAWVVAGRLRRSGAVVFERDGAEHRLVAWPEDDGRLWILFRDATSGVTTYAAMRQLLTSPPAADGTVELDFNRAHNMPCAYTDFATCPVPPAENTLPFAVDAGEQVPLMS